MRLLHPAPGECSDRMTILRLKMFYGSGGQTDVSSRVQVKPDEQRVRVIMDNVTGINTQPFLDEYNQIENHLKAHWIPDLQQVCLLRNADVEATIDRLDDLEEKLFELNHEIWKLTDQAHILKDAPDRAQELANKRAAEVLFSITDLNDKRAKLVRDINSLFDISQVEKIFA